ncbi:MAG TPA: hypothetical protein VK130_08320 [Steroidobacteraceae bacterium]|nr:hypothetical protein [Steroidobacteraceae bacterium]
MNELNLKPATTTGQGAERTAIVANRTAPGTTLINPRGIVSALQRRRRLHAARFRFEDKGFRLFRVY